MLQLALLMFGGVTVDLPAEKNVQGTEMTLGQIATVRGDDPAEVARVEGLALGYAPSPGYSRVIQRWKLIDVAKKELVGIEVAFQGQAACRLWPETAVVTGLSLQEKAKVALQGLFVGEDVSVRAAGSLDDEVVPRGFESRELVAEPGLATKTGGSNRTGSWNVPVRILIDGMPYRTVWATFDVELYRMLPVLQRDVAKGDTIRRGDVALARTAIKSEAGFDPLTEAKLVGASAKRLLRKDEPVGARDVERLVAVKKGETIDLEVENGQIHVIAKVVALEDGYVGDVVSVQVAGSGKELTATIDRMRHVRLVLSING